MQVPAYYDQIVGDLYLVRGGAALAKGSVDTLQEGGGTSVLPPQEQKVAALPANPQPIASFTRSNSGWMVNVSLPEAATQFGYRIGDKGEFTDAGLLDALDQRTGTRMPKTSFEMAPDQGKTAIYVTWRDKRGEQADVVPINFDPTAALVDEQKKFSSSFGRAGSRFASTTACWSISPSSSPIAAQASALRLGRSAGGQDLQAAAMRSGGPEQRPRRRSI